MVKQAISFVPKKLNPRGWVGTMVEAMAELFIFFCLNLFSLFHPIFSSLLWMETTSLAMVIKPRYLPLVSSTTMYFKFLPTFCFQCKLWVRTLIVLNSSLEVVSLSMGLIDCISSIVFSSLNISVGFPPSCLFCELYVFTGCEN